MLLIAGILIALLAALLCNASFSMQHTHENALSVPLLMMAQLVLISQVLSILEHLNSSGYLIGQLIMLVLSLALWWWRGQPPLLSGLRFNPPDIRRTLKTHPVLVVMGLLLGVMIAYYAISGAIARNYFLDAERYHIPRAFLWLQYESANHFFTQNFRMTDFPPNASFIYAWMMALSGHTAGLNIPQAVAALSGALATFGLARAAGFRRSQSVFTALLLLFNLELLNQVQEAQIDLIVMALTGAFMLFVVRVMQVQTRKDAHAQKIYLLYLAIGFGLALGTKYTVLFILPGAAFGFLVYALYHFRREALSVLAACTIASVSGFMVFGSYNYILNMTEYGSPFGSRGQDSSSDIINRNSVDDIDTLFDPAANLVRYGYQFIGLEAYHVILPVRQSDIIQAKNILFEQLFGDSGLQIDYHINETALAVYHVPSTHLLIFSVAILLSPLILLYSLFRSRDTDRYRLMTLYLMSAVSWVLLLALITAWSPWKMRLVLIILPLIAASLFPWLYTSQRRGLLWLIPLLLIASANFGVMQDSPLRGQRAVTTPAGEQYIEVLRPLIPAEGRVGLVGESLAPFLAMRAFPAATYTYIPADDIARQLDENQVDVVLTTSQHCQANPAYSVSVQPLMPVNISCIYTDAAAVETASRMTYLTEASQPVLRIDRGIHLAMLPRGVEFRIPVDFIQSVEGDVHITLHTAAPVDPSYINRVHCEGDVLPHRITPQTIELTWPRDEIPADEPLHLCQLLAFNRLLPVTHVTVRGENIP